MRNQLVGIAGSKFKVFTSLLLCSTALTWACSAGAQEAAGEDEADSRRDEIIVTSQRREQNILDVPYNISSVSGDDIDAGITWDNSELLRSIPGVSQVDQGPRQGGQLNSIRIRGLNVDSSALGDFAVASVATVSTYVNDTPVYANLALVDLDRVEILRGPQGTLYGSGSLGGTLKYFLNQPKLGEFEGSAGAQFSHVHDSNSVGYGLKGVVNVPLGENFALRGNVYWQDYPGLTDYVNIYELDANGVPVQPNGIFDTGYDATNYQSVEDADTFENMYIRVSALWEPTDAFSVTANFISQEQEVGGRRQQSSGVDGLGNPYNDHEIGAVILEPSDQSFSMGSLEANIDFGFATLTSSSSLYDNNGGSDTDNTGFYANNFPNFYYNMPRPLYTAKRTYGDEAFTQELRLVSNGDNKIDYVVGGFYRNQTLMSTQVSDLVGFEDYAAAIFFTPALVTTDNLFTFSRTNEFKDFALFGELTWNATEDLHFTGGARYFNNDTVVSTFIRVGAYVGFQGEVSTIEQNKEKDVLFKANVAYEFSDDDLVYATISEGFRRGGNNGVPTIGRFAESPNWLVYTPDSVVNYEVGIKGTLNDIRYDLSAFYIDWNNPQFNSATSTYAFFAVVNGQEARTKGFEAQLSGYFGEYWDYALGYAFVDAELSKDLVSPIGAVTATTGTVLPGIPKHALNMALNYTRPLNDAYSISGRVDGFAQSKTENVINQNNVFEKEFSGFSTWDITGTLFTDKWSASLFVKNVFNVEATTGAFTEAAFGAAPAAQFFGSDARQFIGLPRTIGVALNTKF